jgi:hypothetical protein
MATIGLVRNPAAFEPIGQYALPGVGTLRAEGVWRSATARAGDASWRFVGRGKNVTAADASGLVVGDYRDRERAVRWDGREFDLLRGWGRSASHYRKRPFLTRDGRYTLAEGGQVFAFLRCDLRRLNPVNLELNDDAGLEPGLLLFVVFLGGCLATRDRNNDGLQIIGGHSP